MKYEMIKTEVSWKDQTVDDIEVGKELIVEYEKATKGGWYNSYTESFDGIVLQKGVTNRGREFVVIGNSTDTVVLSIDNISNVYDHNNYVQNYATKQAKNHKPSDVVFLEEDGDPHIVQKVELLPDKKVNLFLTNLETQEELEKVFNNADKIFKSREVKQ